MKFIALFVLFAIIAATFAAGVLDSVPVVGKQAGQAAKGVAGKLPVPGADAITKAL